MRVFEGQPTLLAGPIVRQSDQHLVNVWFATSEPLKFSGKLFRTLNTNRLVGDTIAQFSICERWQLGQRFYCHMLSIGSGSNLSFDKVSGLRISDEDIPGRNIFYQEYRSIERRGTSLFPHQEILAYTFQAQTESDDETLTMSDLLSVPSILFGEAAEPRLILQDPDDYEPENSLRVLYGSCRKLHGLGEDATLALHQVFSRGHQHIEGRFHALFLGGDQIYADDVAGPLTSHIEKLSEWLIGTPEIFPNININQRAFANAIKFGCRGPTLINYAKFSSDESENHLIRFGEFAAMYLLAWNIELWPINYARFSVLRRNQPEYSYEKHNQLITSLDNAKQGTRAIKRLMANLPTYMIFDDHDVTDDWFLNPDWKTKTMATELGKIIISNGLAAYWAFQAWGNAPNHFNTEFKSAISQYLRTQNTEDFENYFRKLHNFTTWSFMTPTNPPALFLDTRTNRAHAAPSQPTKGARLIAPHELSRMRIMLHAMNLRRKPLILVAPTPILGVPSVETALSEINERSLRAYLSAGIGREDFQRIRNSLHEKLDFESFDCNPLNYDDVLGLLVDSGADPVIVLSGDVHYGFSVNAQILLVRTRKLRIAQFTSSALKNTPESFLLSILSNLTTRRLMLNNYPNYLFFNYRGREHTLVRQFLVNRSDNMLVASGNNMGALSIRPKQSRDSAILHTLYTRRGDQLIEHYFSSYGGSPRRWPVIRVQIAGSNDIFN